MKKLLIFIIIISCLTSLFGCAKDNNGSSAESTAESTTDDATTEEITTVTESSNTTDTCTETDENGSKVTVAKPVIYLYPENKLDISVKLDYNGELTVTYPAYNNGWNVTAYPDGTVIDKATGFEYSYLFWEGITDVEYDMSEGYVVKGSETADFLRNILAEMGLTPREYNEFIVYWLPQMQENEYNLITFQNEAYTENAKLEITPSPDSLLRVFMAFKPLDKPVEVKAPEITPFERNGFTVVEWGGCEVDDK